MFGSCKDESQLYQTSFGPQRLCQKHLEVIARKSDQLKMNMPNQILKTNNEDKK